MNKLERRQQAGGFHVTFYVAGDSIIINHMNETFKIVYQGPNGKDTAQLSLIGPTSFVIGKKPTNSMKVKDET